MAQSTHVRRKLVPLALHNLSPLASASRQLVLHMARGADAAYVESACQQLITKNTNGLGSLDVEVARVAVEVMKGALMGVLELRTPTISAAARGVSQAGPQGPKGDADRLLISERACREVRDSDDASPADYTSALEGAAPAVHLTASQLRALVDRTPRPPTDPHAPEGTDAGAA